MDARQARTAVTIAALGATAMVGQAIVRDPLPAAPSASPAAATTTAAAVPQRAPRRQASGGTLEALPAPSARTVYVAAPSPVAPARASVAPPASAPVPVVQSASS